MEKDKKKNKKEKVVKIEEEEIEILEDFDDINKKKKKRTIIMIIIFSIIIVLGLLVLAIKLSYTFKLNGKSLTEITYKDQYIEEGYTFHVLGKDMNKSVKVTSNVKNGKVGEYQIKYKYKLGFINLEKIRTVKVTDKWEPTIELKGEKEVTICPNSKYEEDGYTANDEYDGDITNKVQTKDLDDKIKYSVSDSSGNNASAIRSIKKEDKEKPEIILKGNTSIYVGLNENYSESGYSVKDNCDNIANEKVKVTGSVDTSKVGVYKITYEVSDESGNKATATRNIHVYDKSNYSSNYSGKKGVIYLTFDDGPSGSGSTAKILNVLKNEGVKATFFVTGNGPTSLIKREFEEGHTIALHTYTHQWSIYKSSEAYFNDLYKIQNLVESITGKKSYIFRFPGGTSNTVSRHQAKGIMSALLSETKEKGFTEFDWNVDSNDAGNCAKSNVSDKSTCVYNNVTRNLSKSRSNIVLMHDIKSYTANAIENIIRYGKNNGYIFEPITEDMEGMSFRPNN